MNGYFKPLRLAGAQARRVLLDAVAAKWNVPVGELSTEPSVVVHKASGRRIGYGEIAAFAKAPAELPKIEERTSRTASFRYIGKDVARVEVPLKVTGAAKYGMDVQVPGMVYAAVLQSPYPGGAPQTSTTPRPQGAGHHRRGEAAGRRRRHRHHGRGHAGRQEPAQGHLVRCARRPSRQRARARGFRRHRPRQEPRRCALREEGDAKAALASAKVFRGEYRTRYVYHAQMEPMNATASVAADGKSAEIWVGTQAASSLLNGVARMLQTERTKLTLHQQFLGGGFGRRGHHEAVLDAVRLAKAVGKPVKLIWSREDDIAFGKFRPTTAHHIEAGLDETAR